MSLNYNVDINNNKGSDEPESNDKGSDESESEDK